MAFGQPAIQTEAFHRAEPTRRGVASGTVLYVVHRRRYGAGL